MIPVDWNDDGVEIKPPNTTHPFMRGIMTFDDYNYKQYNSYVLISEPGQSEKRRILQDRKSLGSFKKDNKLRSQSSLSEENLREVDLFRRSFVHETITLPNSDNELD